MMNPEVMDALEKFAKERAHIFDFNSKEQKLE